jgi:hypothetical protein
VLFEDSTVNMLRESLAFFEEMVQNPIFHYTPVYVLLNKKDVFDQLIKTYPLTECFRDYDGAPGDSARAVDFIKKEFMEIMRTHLPGKAIQFIVMSATVRADSKEAFNQIKTALKRSVCFVSLSSHPVRSTTVSHMFAYIRGTHCYVASGAQGNGASSCRASGGEGRVNALQPRHKHSVGERPTPRG